MSGRSDWLLAAPGFQLFGTRTVSLSSSHGSAPVSDGSAAAQSHGHGHHPTLAVTSAAHAALPRETGQIILNFFTRVLITPLSSADLAIILRSSFQQVAAQSPLLAAAPYTHSWGTLIDGLIKRILASYVLFAPPGDPIHHADPTHSHSTPMDATVPPASDSVGGAASADNLNTGPENKMVSYVRALGSRRITTRDMFRFSHRLLGVLRQQRYV